MLVTADGGRHVDKDLKISFILTIMDSTKFILNYLDGKIQRKQSIGIISVENNVPKEFALGYFRKGIFPYGEYPLGLELGNRSRYNVPEDKIDSYFKIWQVDDKNETIFTDKESFERKMQSLMKVIVKKDNFPLFVRDLSKLDGWK
jgi:hypothetical protein